MRVCLSNTEREKKATKKNVGTMADFFSVHHYYLLQKAGEEEKKASAMK
jgi:hypothetical protein